MRNFYATTHEETKIRSAPFFPSRSNLHRQTWQLTVCLWARSYAVMNFIKEKHIQSIWNGVLSPRSHIVITHIIPLLMNCNASQRWCAKTLVWCGCLPSNSLFHFENFFFLQFPLFINWIVLSAHNVPSGVAYAFFTSPGYVFCIIWISEQMILSFFRVCVFSLHIAFLFFFVRNFDGKCKYFYVSLCARSIYILNK